MKILFFIVTAFLIHLKITDAKTPIIGIVSIYSQGWNNHTTEDWNYIAASYVKWLKAAGAQVVPIQWDLPYNQIDYLLNRVNGVVFTGGNIRVTRNGNPTPIYLAFKHITEYILKKNQDSNYYPLWGTCMGFWNIARILGNNISILTPCEDCVYAKRNVYPGSSYKGRMLRNLSLDLRTKIQQDQINVFLHKDLIIPRVFQKGSRLSQYWTPVAYSYDAAGKKYVSMAESPRYPIYGTQFHPEKPEFENKAWYNIPHTSDAIRFARYLANFFVEEARKNSNVFPNSKSYLIDNYSPQAAPISAYEQVYYFRRKKA